VDDGGATLAEVGPAYDKLKVTLTPNTQILKPPVLNFLADGTLTIDGPIDDASAAGTIFLRRGIVNLFTTEFTLARDYKNTATFIPAQRLDPNLSVLMRASVQEAVRQQFPTPTEHAAEIQETALDLGTLQTVRIEAKATGRASQIANNLELSSSPNRSETEIVALMGGGFVNTLGRGDSTLAIANLASSVLLTQFQSAINQALGLQDFRLFPTTTTRTSSLTLGAELGVNLTDRFSASILQVLDAEQGTRFNLRYRLNDNVLLRGSTDFSEDSRAEIEWNFRF
jgi:translocation and assembly module TamB